MAKKLEIQQWIDIFDGKKVKGANKNVQLNAQLARAAFEENEAEIENEWRTRDHDALLQKILKKGEEIGYLEEYFKKEPTQIFKNTIKGLIASVVLVMGGAYAIKDEIHITHFQEVPNTTIEVSETFWNIVMDETGNRLTVFWPTQKKQIKETRTRKMTVTGCSAEISTLEGCLKLKNKHQAQFNIGLIYEQGLNGVEKNPDIAHEWYKKSAAQGNQRARFNMEYLISKKLVK